MKLRKSKLGVSVSVALLAIGNCICPLGQAMAAPGSTPIRNVDDGVFNPFAVEVSWFSGTSAGFNETSSFTVPANKRLEITEISCEAYAPSSTQVVLKLTATSGGTSVTHYITGFANSTVYVNYSLLGMTSHHLYVDPGTTVTLDVVRQNPAGASTGYYSDVIIAGRQTSL